MEADKTWYKGGYLRFFFQEITKESIKREKKIDSIVCNIIDLQRKAGELLTQHTPRSSLLCCIASPTSIIARQTIHKLKLCEAPL